MKNFFLLLVSLYFLLLGYLYLAQRSFIYFPSFTRPVAVKPNFEFKNEGLLLKGWLLNQEKKNAILYFGGNGERLEYNLSQFDKTFSDKAVYMLSYRGYGSSEGKPTEKGIYSDALALYDSIQKKHESVSVVGRSLGSAVATYVASKRDIDRVVLITPFASVAELAKRQFPIFPVSFLLKDKHLSEDRINEIESRSLIIYAGNDRVIPEVSTQRLIAKFRPGQLKIVKVNGAGHNSISEYSEYEEELQKFMYSETDKALK